MKAVIVCESTHHGNTRKLVDAIAAKFAVEVCDIAQADTIDLNAYELIGFASGISYGKFYEKITSVLREALPGGKKVFFLYTCAQNSGDFSESIRRLAEEKGCESVGSYGCKGFNTYGPLKLIGGMNRKHPDENELQGAVDFFASILSSISH